METIFELIIDDYAHGNGHAARKKFDSLDPIDRQKFHGWLLKYYREISNGERKELFQLIVFLLLA